MLTKKRKIGFLKQTNIQISEIVRSLSHFLDEKDKHVVHGAEQIIQNLTNSVNRIDKLILALEQEETND